MARITLVKTAVLGPYPALPVAANALDVVFAAADVANKNQFAPTGKDLILAWNSGVSPYTITITSMVDDKNRVGDIATFQVDAGDIAAFFVQLPGWKQTDGNVYLEASNAVVKFAVIALPS